MKIRLKKTDKLNKSRSHLVKVAVMINTRTGQHQSHRWINPNKAMDVLKEGIKGAKTTDELTFKDKKTGKTLSEQEVMKEYQRNGKSKTIQEYVREKYKVSSLKTNKRPTKETNQVYRDTSEGVGTYRERLDNYQTESLLHPVLRLEDFEYANARLADKLGTQNAFRPDTLNGAKRNKPMTFEQANNGKPNPKYGKNGGYGKNCQSCVVVFEARLRGYDLETLPNLPGSGCKELAKKSSEAWIDPETGENFSNRELSFEGGTALQLYKKIDETVQIGERYIFAFPWKGRGYKGHVINVYKNEAGNLVFYDPQINEFTLGEKLIKSYLDKIKYNATFLGRRVKETHRLLRVDDKIIDPNWLERISQPSEVPTEGLVPDADELDIEPESDIYEALNDLIDENTIQELEQRLEPLYSKATGGRGGNKKASAVSDIEHASQIIGIHLNNKPTSENKENLKLEMDRFYQLLKSGSMTLSQAIASQQFKNAAYLFILALLDEDTDEEISDLLDAIL